MKQFWKKGIAILLVLVSVLSLCACGADNTPSDSETPTIGNEESTDKAPENLNGPFYATGIEEGAVSLLSTAPYEDEYVKVDITRIELTEDDANGIPENSLLIYFTLENRTTHGLSVIAERAYINGLYCDANLPRIGKIPSGATEEFYAVIEACELERNNITQIGHGDLVLEHTATNRRATTSFVSKENYNQRNYTDGEVIYDDNTGCKIIAQGYGNWSPYLNEHMRFYVENNSERVWRVKTITCSGVDRYFTEDKRSYDICDWVVLEPGKTGYLYSDMGNALKSGATTFKFHYELSNELFESNNYHFAYEDTFVTQALSTEPVDIAR